MSFQNTFHYHTSDFTLLSFITSLGGKMDEDYGLKRKKTWGGEREPECLFAILSHKCQESFGRFDNLDI